VDAGVTFGEGFDRNHGAEARAHPPNTHKATRTKAMIFSWGNTSKK